MIGLTRTHAIEVKLPIEGRMPFFCRTQARELDKWLKAKTRDDQGMAYSFVSSTVAPSREYHTAGWIVTIVFNTYGDDLQVNELMEMIKDQLTALSIDHRKISEHGTVKKHDDTDEIHFTLAALRVCKIV